MKINLSNINEKQRTGLASIGGVFLALCSISLIPVFAFIALIPIIFSLNKSSLKSTIKNGFISGISAGIFSNFWMIKTISEFSNFQMGLLSYLFGMLLLGFIFILVFLVFYPFVNIKLNVSFKILSIACSWAIIEWLVANYLKTTFWLHPVLYRNLLNYEFLVQPAVFGGGVFISFLATLINGALAFYIIKQQKIRFYHLIGSILCFLLISSLALVVYPENKNGAPIKVTLINAAHPLHLEWDETTGDKVVNEILKLNKAAYKTNSDLHIWTEAIVPWTFSKKDDFLNAILAEDNGRNVGNIIGMLSEYHLDTFYNSAYYFEKDFINLQRYDKRFPLAFSEGPVRIFNIPILRSIDFVIMPGNYEGIFNTNVGTAGIAICNETILDPIYKDIYMKNPDFLVGITNDGWLSNSKYLLNQHILNNRLRAIESRKDIIFNSNLGFSGVFNSMGKEIFRKKDAHPYIQTVSINSQNKITFYVRYLNLIPYLYFVLAIFILILNYSKFNNNRKKLNLHEKNLYSFYIVFLCL
ncbi:MAG TPA: apolipoprotein N-acyltransferase [Edaphocola sp.]|nr:apolipoprotein N-acyltransferase [Edaphocola sp.]